MAKLVKVEVPEAFEWVLDYIKDWHYNKKTGEIRISYKSGGVTGVSKKEYHQPPKFK